MIYQKCWDASYIRAQSNPNKSQYEHYLDLLKENEDDRTHYME